MNLLRECTIKTYILPYLSRGKRGKTMSDESYVPVIQAILHRLKTGCQWRQLPIREFFGNRPYTWEAVYYHFQQWSKHDCWRNVWVALLRAHKGLLDLSQAELDGTLTGHIAVEKRSVFKDVGKTNAPIFWQFQIAKGQ
jgi:transposase